MNPEILCILARNRRELVALAVLSRDYLVYYHKIIVWQYSTKVTTDFGTEYYLGCQRHRDKNGPFGAGPAIVWDRIPDRQIRSWHQFGKLHRDDGPAYVYQSGNRYEWEWWNRGLRHRIGGPALRTGKQKTYTLVWYRDGEKCRLDGPARIIRKRGRVLRREWYEFGQRHRADGPAIVGKNYHTYYLFGCLHRTDGPAHRCSTSCRPGIWHCRGDNPKSLKRIKCEWTESWFCHGKLHRFWDWAVVSSLGEKRWYCRGEVHRPPGPEPAVITICGKKIWYRHGRKHRLDGPAKINGSHKIWYRNGKLHRPELGQYGGPAVSGCYGMEWWQNNRTLRENGPSCITKHGETWEYGARRI